VREALVVIAKAPVPGRVKTRLCPPCSPGQAAALAEAALRDTLDAVRATPAARRVVVLDGAPGAWLGPGLEVLAQRGDGLDERLAAAFADVGGPALVVGMDTPQVTPALLEAGLRALGDNPAVLGDAHDGGFWALGLRSPDPRLLVGVPMSTAHTGGAQRARLLGFGLRPGTLPALADVDDIAGARAVAATAPSTRFAALLRDLGLAEEAAA
jgi:rSAM/selenodomain-associated transferase 1